MCMKARQDYGDALVSSIQGVALGIAPSCQALRQFSGIEAIFINVVVML